MSTALPLFPCPPEHHSPANLIPVDCWFEGRLAACYSRLGSAKVSVSTAGLSSALLFTLSFAVPSEAPALPRLLR